MNADMTIPIKEVYRLRLKPFVNQEIVEDQDHVYLDKHNQEEWQRLMLTEMLEYLPFEQLMDMTDDELKELIGKQMALELVAGMLNDFTPEQMATFNECLVRR